LLPPTFLCYNFFNFPKVFLGSIFFGGNKMQNQDLDNNSTGLNVLSFFIPIIGLVLYLVLKKDQPIKAAGIGK